MIFFDTKCYAPDTKYHTNKNRINSMLPEWEVRMNVKTLKETTSFYNITNAQYEIIFKTMSLLYIQETNGEITIKGSSQTLKGLAD
jgi:hypothetical protein